MVVMNASSIIAWSPDGHLVSHAFTDKNSRADTAFLEKKLSMGKDGTREAFHVGRDRDSGHRGTVASNYAGKRRRSGG